MKIFEEPIVFPYAREELKTWVTSNMIITYMHDERAKDIKSF